MKFKNPDILKDGEEVIGSGQDTLGYHVFIRCVDGSERSILITEEDLDEPIIGMSGWLQMVVKSLPELPEARRNRYQAVYKLSEYDSGVLTSTPEISDYFDDLVEYCGDGKSACNWLMGSWMAALKRDGLEVKECPIPTASLGELVNLINSNILTHNLAKQIFEKMWEEKLTPKEIIYKYDMVQKQDSGELEKIIEKIIIEDQKALEEYRNGKVAIIGHFVGKVMRETKGKSNPKTVNELVKIKLEMMK